MVLRCASNKRLTNVNNLCKLLRVLHFELGNIVLMNHALYHQDLLFLLLVIIKMSMAFLSFPLLNFRYASYVNSTWNLKNGVFKMVVLLLYGPCGVSCKWEEYGRISCVNHLLPCPQYGPHRPADRISKCPFTLDPDMGQHALQRCCHATTATGCQLKVRPGPSWPRTRMIAG